MSTNRRVSLWLVALLAGLGVASTGCGSRLGIGGGPGDGRLDGGLDVQASRDASTTSDSACAVGYAPDEQAICQDIDECVEQMHDCDPLTSCTNTAGSFDCGPCPRGYSGTGKTGCTGGHPAVHFVGRHVSDGADKARFGWPGAGLVVRFNGTGARVRMNDPSGYFALVVDGQVQPVLVTQSGERVYELAADLPAGVHTVELYRRPEGLLGPTEVVSVEVDGQLMAPPPVTRRMEVIGDSISCGYGIEGPDRYCAFSAETENHYLTYGAVAARAAGAEVSTIAWHGKGIVFNYGDDRTDTMPEIYARTVPTESNGTWDFSWQPDVVVINLGTNDFSTDGDPTEQQFVSAYGSFLARLRGNYADALILCAVAPKLKDDDRARAESYIQRAVEQRNTAGDLAVKWVDLWVEPIGCGCICHPSVATNAAMAQRLTQALQKELGW